MFKNVGRELKNWAKAIVIFLTIPWVLAALIVIGMAIGDGDAVFIIITLFACPLLALLGYWLSRLAGIMLYAFGELVENTQIMKNALTMDVSEKSR